jgi:ABC-type dipeptide/oligopeptide/nickel transport system permease component
MALQPIAQRMGLATSAAFSSPDRAVAFWTRFWEERSIDFKPAVVRRAVRRQATHGSVARRAALLELDTYALTGLMEALQPVHTLDDVARTHRLLDVAAHVTGKDPCVRPNMAPSDADRCVGIWREWWLVSHTDFDVLSGPDRISATLTETQYGKWALQALTLQLGVGPDGVTVLERLRSNGPRTVGLAILALILAYGVAFPLGLICAQWQRGVLDNLTSLGLLGLLALPVPILAVALAHLANGSFTLAVSTVVIASALLTVPSRHQRLAAIDEIGRDWIRHGRACGIHPARLLLVHVGRPAGTLGLALVALDFPLAMSAVCVAEHAFQLDGLGPHIVRAVLQRDVAFLMAFGLTATALHALLLLASDIMTGWLDPRLNRSIHGEHAWP